MRSAVEARRTIEMDAYEQHEADLGLIFHLEEVMDAHRERNGKRDWCEFLTSGYIGGKPVLFNSRLGHSSPLELSSCDQAGNLI